MRLAIEWKAAMIRILVAVLGIATILACGEGKFNAGGSGSGPGNPDVRADTDQKRNGLDARADADKRLDDDARADTDKKRNDLDARADADKKRRAGGTPDGADGETDSDEDTAQGDKQILIDSDVKHTSAAADSDLLGAVAPAAQTADQRLNKSPIAPPQETVGATSCVCEAVDQMKLNTAGVRTTLIKWEDELFNQKVRSLENTPAGNEICVTEDPEVPGPFFGFPQRVVFQLSPPSCVPEQVGLREDYGIGCFAPDTSIEMADHSLRPIHRVKTGDLVWEPRRRAPVKVALLVVGAESLPLIEFRVATGTLRVTTLHPMFTRAGLKQAVQVTPQDELLAVDGTYRAIQGIRQLPVDPRQLVYNLILETNGAASQDLAIAGDGLVTGDLSVQRRLAQAYAPVAERRVPQTPLRASETSSDASTLPWEWWRAQAR